MVIVPINPLYASTKSLPKQTSQKKHHRCKQKQKKSKRKSPPYTQNIYRIHLISPHSICYTEYNRRT